MKDVVRPGSHGTYIVIAGHNAERCVYMVKVIYLLVFFLLFTLAACGRGNERNERTGEYTHDKPPSDEQITYNLPTEENEYIVPEGGFVYEPTEPAYCIYLADFDFMMDLMEATFPFFEMVYRMYGIDIRAQGAAARDILVNYPYSLMDFAYSVGMTKEDMPEMNAYVLWSILTHDFFSHFNFAHSTILGVARYNMLFPFASMAVNFTPLENFNRHAMTNPVTVAFYREFESLMSAPIRDNLHINQIIARRDLRAVDSPAPAAPPLPTLITESIEEGRIAYLEITTFLVNPTLYNRALSDFYSGIQQYEHLIIDIRRNGGGVLEFARAFIMHPLMPDRNNMPDMPLYVLYRSGETGRRFGEMHIESQPRTGREFVRQSDYLLPIDEITTGGSLTYLHEDDLQNLAYGFRVNTSLMHYNRRVSMAPVPFHGQIWLLTGAGNASSSAMFARQAKHMNFATLVGEAVSGHYTATYMVYFYLPNTGIVVQWDIDYLTDETGRALNEFPTNPHYFNRENMCALETVLAMINENN